MPKLSIVVPGSATAAFYSQIAATCIALRKLSWKRWEPSVHAFFGGNGKDTVFHEWASHLADVDIVRVAARREAALGNWAQVDDAIRLAPRDADVVMSMDADTLPVASFEDMLDEVHGAGAIAGVMAHYPFPMTGSPWDYWRRLAAGLISQPIDFRHSLSLVGPDEPEERRIWPFYLNGGAVALARRAFDRFAPTYLGLRPKVELAMEASDYSAQVAMTLAVAEEQIPVIELPVRYNFPNDAVAAAAYPSELESVVIFHYLRHQLYDRHTLFASADAYTSFLSLPLTGVDLAFQQAVRATFGSSYPFHRLAPSDTGP